MELNEARELIRKVDEEMAALFVSRMEAVRAVAAYKREHGLPIEDKEQEKRVIEGRSALIEDPELRAFYVQFLQGTIEVSKGWQRRLSLGMRVAYSGVEGAFAHVAAMRIFPDATPVSCLSFEAAYRAVEAGECDVAVLPIENSSAGEVGAVLDLMLSGGLYINGVYDLSVSHCLLGVPGATVSDVKRVVSHPQALEQCRAYIREHGFDSEIGVNTAVAAQSVAARGDKSVAAIASGETAYRTHFKDTPIPEELTKRYGSGNVRAIRIDGRIDVSPRQNEPDAANGLAVEVKTADGKLVHMPCIMVRKKDGNFACELESFIPFTDNPLMRKNLPTFRAARGYKPYYIDRIRLTAAETVVVTGVDCKVQFHIGAAYDPEHPAQEYDIYLSIKYLSGDRVLIDRMYVCKATGRRGGTATRKSKTKTRGKRR